MVWRAKIVLATADGHGTNEIMRRTGKSKPCVWRWQERYVAEVRRPAARQNATTGQEAVAGYSEAQGVDQDSQRDAAERDALEPSLDGSRDGHQSVECGRIWTEAGLKPHLVRRFKISNDPQFEEKVTDVVGLYMDV